MFPAPTRDLLAHPQISVVLISLASYYVFYFAYYWIFPVNYNKCFTVLAYETERHQRPALTIHTFHAPESSLSQPASPVPQETSSTVIYSSNTTPKPPVPSRCSSLEGPALPSSKSKIYNRAVQSVLQQAGMILFLNLN